VSANITPRNPRQTIKFEQRDYRIQAAKVIRERNEEDKRNKDEFYGNKWDQFRLVRDIL